MKYIKSYENLHINCYGVKKGDIVIAFDDSYNASLPYGEKYIVHSVLHDVNYHYKEKKKVDNENDVITLINPNTNREFRKSGGELVFKIKYFITPEELEIKNSVNKYNL